LGELLFFCEFILDREKTEEFSSGTIFQEEVKFTLILKTHLELD
jgi:hypothetical protein